MMSRAKLRNRVRFLLLSAALVTSPTVSASETEDKSAAAEWDSAYCGLHALYGACRALDVEVNFDGLLQPRFVGSTEGSSLEELQRAANACGLSALPVEGLSSATLARSTVPVILHIPHPRNTNRGGHWVLFLGCEGGAARILDFPQPTRTVSFANLLAEWDGMGLALSKQPLSRVAFLRHEWLSGAMYLAGGAGLCACLSLCRFQSLHRRARCLALAADALCVIGIPSLTGAAYHCVHPDGLLANMDAVAAVERGHLGSLLDVYTAADVRQLSSDSDVVIVDARLARDFDRGHVPGAINLPAIAPAPDAMTRFESTVPRNAKIIVYCQSRACRFDEDVAQRLLTHGYSRLGLFAGGWEEWQSSANPVH